MQKQFRLTHQGIEELEKEKQALINQRGPIAERIKLAREFGDLSENAEYSAAKQEQERTEARISEIDYILKNTEIIDKPSKKDVVELGNTVVLKGVNGEKSFTIVGSVEADPLEGKVSDESPIGRSLLGKKVSEEIEIVTPESTDKYRIKSIG